MYGCLIVCKSITYAQRAKRVLSREGISASIVRPPIEIFGNSCGYAVKISEGFLGEALEIMRNNGFDPTRVITLDRDGSYREMKA